MIFSVQFKKAKLNYKILFLKERKNGK